MSTPVLRVYWQPGCTSCLRAKEFLRGKGFEFESINVREQPAALAELLARGIRAVPVIARGEDYVLGQDIDELARFVGVTTERQSLPPALLLARLDRLLQVASLQAALVPEACWSRNLPQRERTWLDLGYHVAMVVRAFLEAAGGGALRYESYELRAPPGSQTAAGIAGAIAAARAALAAWAAAESPLQASRPLQTYFGVRELQTVLERTAWHVAQHARQLQSLLTDTARVTAAVRLEPADFSGLPLPEALWDAEIQPP